MNDNYHLKGMAFPRTYNSLFGNKGQCPYFPIEFLRTLGDKEAQLDYVREEWLMMNPIKS